MPRISTTPGTYVAEVPFATRVIESLPSGVAAFVGTTMKGPLNKPTLVNSFAGFEAEFGGLDSSSDLSYAVAHYFENGGRIAGIVRIERSGNAPPSVSQVVGSSDEQTGLYALSPYDMFDALVVPNRSEPEIHAAMVSRASECLAIAILDLPEAVRDPVKAMEWLNANEELKSSNAAAYFPRVIMKDKAQRGRRRSFANSGLVAGIYARTDAEKGVWEAPAGANTPLIGVDRLEYGVNEKEIALLSSSGLNVLRKSAGKGQVIWGARTLAGEEEGFHERRYLEVSRFLHFLQRNLYQGLIWTGFEPSSDALAEELQLQVELYLRRLYMQGAFRDHTPHEAYDVSCTQSYDGGVEVSIGFAPVPPRRVNVVWRFWPPGR